MSIRRFASLAVSCAIASVLPLGAQLSNPPNPGKSGRRNLGEGGGSAVSTGSAKPSPVVTTYVAVTPMQIWTNAGGKAIEARLLAFSAPPEGESGPVEVVRNGKVRFLLAGAKAPVDYPLAGLDETSRARVEAIAKAAAKGPPSAP